MMFQLFQNISIFFILVLKNKDSYANAINLKQKTIKQARKVNQQFDIFKNTDQPNNYINQPLIQPKLFKPKISLTSQMSSSTRLSKLSQYLQDGNYEQAVDLYNRRVQSPQTEEEYLLLAKAFYVGQHYSNVLTLVKDIQNAKKIDIAFEAKFLKLKAKYLYSTLEIDQVLKVQNWIKDNQKYFNQYHFMCIQQIKSIVQRFIAVKASKFPSKQVINDQKTQFTQLFRKYDNYTPIMQGMPVYLISKRWFQQWQQFVSFDSKVTGQNPGPMTNFEIIDHIYHGFFDDRKHKLYTSIYLFEPSKYQIIPKQCWEFLHQRYGGIPVVRYNISDSIKSSEIMTEVYLKRIALVEKTKIDTLRNLSMLKDIVTYVQITKKQTWKGFIQSKLQRIWGPNGMILEIQGDTTKKVDLNQFLEDCDTAGKIYMYVGNYQDSNQSQVKNKQKCANKTCVETDDLKFCQCKSLKYCGMECLKEDRDRHRKKCELQMHHLKQKSAIIENFNLSQKQYSGRKGLVGLRNLGNTCYMNSGLQCLSNTKEITEYFMSNGFLKDINSSNPLGTKGNLACAYAELMREMWAGKDDVVSPFELKKMIGKFATQFTGYGQQDSQELISYLIDGLQQDLNLVKKKQTFETKDQILPDEVASLQSERNYAKRIQSYIRDLMAGQFKSTVQCLKCKKLSICFDPFLLVSLPIPKPKICEFFLVNIDLSHGAIGLTFEVGETTTFKQLDNAIRMEYKDIGKIMYMTFERDNFEVKRIVDNINENISPYMREGDAVFGYEIPEPDGQSDIYFTDYFHQKERCSFPRFMKFPKSSWQKYYQRVIEQSIKRVSQQPFSSNIQSANKLTPPQPYNRICSKYLNIQCKKFLKLLTYKDNRNFSFPRQDRKGLTLSDCLAYFSNKELLEKQNQWYCSMCKTFVNAQKQLEIYKSNKILVLAFKRFNKLQKIKSFIDFPVQGFDMGPYLKCNKQKRIILYDLYGVVNHYGSLGGGHYTAFGKNFINKRWYEFNDSHVSQISKKDIVSDSSYVLFFRRRD